MRGKVRKIKIYKKEIQKIVFHEFGKTWAKPDGIVRESYKKKIYKKEIRKIILDKFGKTKAKLDRSFNSNLTINVGNS